MARDIQSEFWLETRTSWVTLGTSIYESVLQFSPLQHKVMDSASSDPLFTGKRLQTGTVLPQSQVSQLPAPAIRNKRMTKLGGKKKKEGKRICYFLHNYQHYFLSSSIRSLFPLPRDGILNVMLRQNKTIVIVILVSKDVRRVWNHR